MKKILLVLSALLSIVVLMAFGGGGSDVHSSTGGAPAGHSGDPAAGGKTCNTSGCHTGATVGNLTGVITSNIPPAGYTAGGTYTITANFVRTGHSKFGFQVSPQNTIGTKLGTLANISGTQLVGTGGKYVTHLSSSATGSGSKTWNFRWTAPTTGLGPVTFYGAFNATNNNGSDTGDSIFKSTLVITENTTAVNNFHANNFSLSTFPNPTHDKLNIKFTLPESASAEMDLLDINGNKISNLFSEGEMNREVSRSFDISSHSQGIYFIRLHVDRNYTLHKIIKI